MGEFFILVIFAIQVLFLVGLIMTIAAKPPKEKKLGIKLLIASVIMLIIAGGVCGLMMNGLGGMH